MLICRRVILVDVRSCPERLVQSTTVIDRLQAMDISLPEPPKPSGNFVPYRRHNDIVQLSGVAPTCQGNYVFQGRLGAELSVAEGYRAARLCALNAIAQLQEACSGQLDTVRRVLSIRGFVRATPDFELVPKVVDGASDLVIAAFGEQVGRHARTSIGCATLPAGVAVEIDLIVAVNSASTEQCYQQRIAAASPERYFFP